MADVPITGIDHPIIAVRDMAAGRAAYERLGFTITPRGRHLEWGTGNWCIMFEQDYLELRGIVDPAAENPAHRIPGRDGLMGIALSTDSAEACYAALIERRLHPQPVRRLTRDFELPERTVQPKFALCFLDAAETPGLMSVVLCQHLTPELLRRPDWLQHSNGTRAVRAMSGIVPDIAAAVKHYGKIFGAQAIVEQNDTAKIQINSRHSISLMTPDLARELWPDYVLPSVREDGCLLSVTLEVDDVSATQRYFASRDIECDVVSEGAIRISPADSCGVPLEFTDRIE